MISYRQIRYTKATQDPQCQCLSTSMLHNNSQISALPGKSTFRTTGNSEGEELKNPTDCFDDGGRSQPSPYPRQAHTQQGSSVMQKLTMPAAAAAVQRCSKLIIKSKTSTSYLRTVLSLSVLPALAQSGSQPRPYPDGRLCLPRQPVPHSTGYGWAYTELHINCLIALFQPTDSDVPDWSTQLSGCCTLTYAM